MKTVKTFVFSFAFALLAGAAWGQNRDGFDRMPPHEQMELSKSVRLFPNPAIDYVSVKFETPIAKHASFSVHSIIGSTIEVESEVIDDFEIRLRVKELPTGYYLVALKDETSNERGTFKFLKR